MLRLRSAVIIAAFIALASVRAGAAPKSDFVLPKGDVEKGKAAFVALGCNNCHAVHGVRDIAEPTVKPAVPLLGGHVRNAPTDAYLATAIINPQHSVTKTLGAPNTAKPDGSSRMPDFSERMTVRQLIDITAFLHSRDWRDLQK
jgi:L-cysteine S-thiosulfotransferase